MRTENPTQYAKKPTPMVSRSTQTTDDLANLELINHNDSAKCKSLQFQVKYWRSKYETLQGEEHNDGSPDSFPDDVDKLASPYGFGHAAYVDPDPGEVIDVMTLFPTQKPLPEGLPSEADAMPPQLDSLKSCIDAFNVENEWKRYQLVTGSRQVLADTLKLPYLENPDLARPEYLLFKGTVSNFRCNACMGMSVAPGDQPPDGFFECKCAVGTRAGFSLPKINRILLAMLPTGFQHSETLRSLANDLKMKFSHAHEVSEATRSALMQELVTKLCEKHPGADKKVIEQRVADAKQNSWKHARWQKEVYHPRAKTIKSILSRYVFGCWRHGIDPFPLSEEKISIASTSLFGQVKTSTFTLTHFRNFFSVAKSFINLCITDETEKAAFLTLFNAEDKLLGPTLAGIAASITLDADQDSTLSADLRGVTMASAEINAIRLGLQAAKLHFVELPLVLLGPGFLRWATIDQLLLGEVEEFTMSRNGEEVHGIAIQKFTMGPDAKALCEKQDADRFMRTLQNKGRILIVCNGCFGDSPHGPEFCLLDLIRRCKEERASWAEPLASPRSKLILASEEQWHNTIRDFAEILGCRFWHAFASYSARKGQATSYSFAGGEPLAIVATRKARSCMFNYTSTAGTHQVTIDGTTKIPDPLRGCKLIEVRQGVKIADPREIWRRSAYGTSGGDFTTGLGTKDTCNQIDMKSLSLAALASVIPDSASSTIKWWATPKLIFSTQGNSIRAIDLARSPKGFFRISHRARNMSFAQAKALISRIYEASHEAVWKSTHRWPSKVGLSNLYTQRFKDAFESKLIWVQLRNEHGALRPLSEDISASTILDWLKGKTDNAPADVKAGRVAIRWAEPEKIFEHEAKKFVEARNSKRADIWKRMAGADDVTRTRSALSAPALSIGSQLSSCLYIDKLSTGLIETRPFGSQKNKHAGANGILPAKEASKRIWSSLCASIMQHITPERYLRAVRETQLAGLFRRFLFSNASPQAIENGEDAPILEDQIEDILDSSEDDQARDSISE